MPLICFGLVAILGLMALTVDVGRMTATKSATQNSCDASALAGAGALSTSATAAMDQAALWYLANRTGGTTQPSGTGTNPRTYTAGGDALTIKSPYSDTFTTSKGWSAANLIEVRVSRTLQLPFGAAVGVPTATVVSRAVALTTSTGTGVPLFFAKGPTGSESRPYLLNTAGSALTVRGDVWSNNDINESGSNHIYTHDVHANGLFTPCSTETISNRAEYGTPPAPSGSGIHAYLTTPTMLPYPAVAGADASGNPIWSGNGAWTNVTTVSSLSGIPIVSGSTYKPGTYHVTGDLSITGTNKTFSNMTFIVDGKITVTGSGHLFSANQNNMIFYSTYVTNLNTNASIDVSGSGPTWTGDMFAPFGRINFSGSGGMLYQGRVMGKGIGITGSNLTVQEIPGRGGLPGVVKLVE